jgi:hypothetical protein
MGNAANAAIHYESGQTPTNMTALTDTGDHKTFNSAAEVFSRKSGFRANIKPNGLATGGAVTPAASGTNDLVDGAALTCYLAGVLTEVAADTDLACTRGADTDTHIINSITVTDAGAYAVVAGTDGAAFSETRDAEGGPPLIPVGSIEIAQVRLSSIAAAAITAAEIYAIVGTHVERFDYPPFSEASVRVENRIMGFAGVDFATALPLIHTGPAAKKVYASYYEPEFIKVPVSADFVPAETTHSTNSKQYYETTKGSVSSSIGQSSFTAVLEDGISDSFLEMKNQTIWFKFFKDKLDDKYVLTNGKLGISRQFPAGDDITAACTVSAEDASVEVIG